MKLYLPCIIFSLFVSNLANAQNFSSPSSSLIINSKLQLNPNFFSKNNTWQGLYCVKNNCAIKNIKIQIEKQFVDYLYDEKVQISTIKAPGKPIAIFPKQHFKKGSVTSWYESKKHLSEEFIFSDTQQFKDLKNGKWIMPWGSQPLTISWNQGNEGILIYHLTDGKRTQVLFEIPKQSKYEGDTTPIIHWVGDLDHDNKSDIILEIPDDNCGFDYRLYLSSKANKKEILKEFLKFNAHEEACGC